MSIPFTLPFHSASLPLARKWLGLAVTSLAVGGIFAILLVASRAPGVQERIPFRDFFHTALVIHVNLLVLVWFLAVAGMLWTALSPRGGHRINQVGFGLFSVGAVILCLAGFVEDAHPLMNNYVPVLQHPLFVGSILSMALGIAISAVWCTVPALRHWRRIEALPLGILSTGVITLIALICFMLSYAQVTYQGDATWYYEQLFWAGGHMLQFVHVQLLMVSWVWLAARAGFGIPREKPLKALFALNLLGTVPIPLLCLVMPVDSAYHHEFFTHHMRWCLGLGPVLLVALYLFRRMPAAATTEGSRAILIAGLACSVILFAQGGFIGFAISGYNTTIPAHYHASIVAITITYMALIYSLAAPLGLRAVRARFVITQLVLYTFGQFVHVVGLAISGDAGALRKSAETITDPVLKQTMKLASHGAGIALIGGFLFVWLMVWMMLGRRPR